MGGNVMLTVYLLGVAFLSGMLAEDVWKDFDFLTMSKEDIFILFALTLIVLFWPVWVLYIIGAKLVEYIAKPV